MKQSKKINKTNLKNKNAITLIALVVTIVVLLILAGITVGMVTSDNGILKKTKNAKQQAEIDNEKSIVERAKMLAMMRSKNGAITYEIFEPAIKDEAGKMPTDVSDAGDTIEVLFKESNRYYEIDQDGNVSEPQEVVRDEFAGDITKGGRCDGSEEKPYEINCIEDLVALSNIINVEGVKINRNGITEVTKTDRNNIIKKSFILTRDLNFKSKFSYSDSKRTDYGDLNGDDTDENELFTEMTTGTGFTSIGYRDIYQFQGIFEGNGKSIKNIYINNTKHTQANCGEGLFGLMNESKITNLKISGEINGGVERTGSIVGFAKGNVDIINCENKCNIKGGNSTGGIVGDEYGKIRIINSSNIGIVSAEKRNGGTILGGVMGHINANTNFVINCYNHGNLQNNDSNGSAGGIIGHTSGVEANVYNSYNTGKITGYSEGAIIGGYWYGNWISIIKNCYYLKDSSKFVIGKVVTTQEFDATECTSQEMKSTEIVNKLNEYVTTYNEENKNNEDFVELKYWKTGDNGYPTFAD